MPPTRTPAKLVLNSGPATWTNQPAALTEFLGTPDRRVKADLTDCDRVRLAARVSTAGAAGAVLFAQWSADEVGWNALTTQQLPIAAAGTRATPWEDVPAGARGDVFLRLAGSGGNGAADPVVGTVVLEVR
jgi:hypothetical protein